MTRSTRSLCEVSYRLDHVELVGVAREVIAAQFPGGALIDQSAASQRCEFLDAAGQVLDVRALVITTSYENDRNG